MAFVGLMLIIVAVLLYLYKQYKNKLIFIALIIILMLFSIKFIPAGYIGVEYQFGAIVGEISEGINVIPPWWNVSLANVRVQRYTFDDLVCFSKETQEVYIKSTINYQIEKTKIKDLYRNIGPDYLYILIQPRVIQLFKNSTVKYDTVMIAPNRETIRKEVMTELNKDPVLIKYSINIVDILLENIDMNQKYKDSIEAKQIATQQALEEKERVEAEKRKAEQEIEKARGRAMSVLIEAEKQAEANIKLSKSITPELIQYQMIQKLSDKIQVIILPAGQNFILDPKNLFGAIAK